MLACLTPHWSCCYALVYISCCTSVFNENLIYLLTLRPFLAAFISSLGFWPSQERNQFVHFVVLTGTTCKLLLTQKQCVEGCRFYAFFLNYAGFLYLCIEGFWYLKASAISFTVQLCVLHNCWWLICNQLYWHHCGGWQAKCSLLLMHVVIHTFLVPFEIISLFKTRIVGCQRDYIVQSSDTNRWSTHTTRSQLW